jgi:signal peptidase I
VGLGRRVKTGLLVASLAVIFVSTFLFDTATMRALGMFPTLLPGDVISITKYSYVLDSSWNPPAFLAWTKRAFGRLPNTGDIVAFKTKADVLQVGLGRVIARPGDRVVFKGGIFSVNETPIVQQAVTDVSTGPLAEFQISPECRLNGNVLPNAVEFRSVSCLKGFVDSEFTLPNNRLYVVFDLWNQKDIGGFVDLQDVEGTANFVIYSTKQTDGSFRWDRFFKRL